MCGIAGVIWPGRPDDAAAAAERIAVRLGHRGPDGAGAIRVSDAAFAHRRLAIIDPVGSTQPMASEDGALAIAYNGELYNFRELRAELEGAGLRFRTAGDTEVVLRAYERWGAACVERFRGMFAFALADRRKGGVLLARDHFGIKPLFVLAEADRLLFASEFQALAPEAADLRLDRAAIDDYLRLGYIPAPRTAARTIAKLRPAHRAWIPFTAPALAQERYWRLPTPAPRTRSFADCVDEAEAVLAASVRAHTVADVPFGAFLSGGVDSALVTALLARATGAPRTFTIGFAEPTFDEREPAAATAAAIGADHTAAAIEPDALALLPELVRRYGEPFGDSSALPTWHVSRLARTRVPMVISGDGGDELFAGYDAHRAWRRWLAMPPMRRSLRALLARIRPRRWPPRGDRLANWLRHIAVLDDRERAALWQPGLRPEAAIPSAFVEAAAAATGIDAARLAPWLDAQTYLPDDILAKVDVASMAHGLEVRTPLVDVRVAEFAATLPDAALWDDGGEAPAPGKRILRALLARVCPPAAVPRRKQGFAVPLDRWLGDGAALRRRLVAADSPLRELFAPAALAAVAGRRRPSDLWPLIALDEWMRQNAGRWTW